MKRLYYTIFIFPLIFNLHSCTEKQEVGLLLINGRIYTIDSLFSTVQAFAVHDGKFVATGSTREIQKKYSSRQTIDASGMIVYPGFIDAHCHFYGYGEGLGAVDLSGTTSFKEVLERLSNSGSAGAGAWIRGAGWDQNDWVPREFPDREKLDSLYPDRPVILTRIDGHAALVNARALEIAGISTSTKIRGGEFLLKNGKLSGMLIDAAVGYVESFIPEPGKEDIRRSLLSAQERCLSVGLTSIQDAGLPGGIIRIMEEMYRNNELKIRIYAMLSPSQENIVQYMQKGIFRDEHLHIRSVKLFADGALGSRGARLIQPYSDDPGNSGLWVTDTGFIKMISILADSCGYQVNTHCIGDAASHEVLKIYGEILKGRNDKRWRIEHSQVIASGDFRKFGEYGIIPSVQTSHATSDMYWAPDRLGVERVKFAYAYRRLLEQNGWLPNGSDFPVEDINPLYGFYAAVSRKDRQGYPPGGFLPSDALTREEALKSMTIWAAKAAFEEDVKGSIEKGKYADFVICDGDIMALPEDQIFKVKVKGTFISGLRVFGE